MDRILPMVDEEITDAVARMLKGIGVAILHIGQGVQDHRDQSLLRPCRIGKAGCGCEDIDGSRPHSPYGRAEPGNAGNEDEGFGHCGGRTSGNECSRHLCDRRRQRPVDVGPYGLPGRDRCGGTYSGSFIQDGLFPDTLGYLSSAGSRFRGPDGKTGAARSSAKSRSAGFPLPQTAKPLSRVRPKG